MLLPFDVQEELLTAPLCLQWLHGADSSWQPHAGSAAS